MTDIAKHPLLQQAYDVMQAIEVCGASIELTEAVTKAGALLQALDAFMADGVLSLEQEPKYDVRYGRLVNRATGEPIPDDEPIMIFRAQDARARKPLREYGDSVSEDGKGGTTPTAFERYQAFVTFAAQHPERMREPD